MTPVWRGAVVLLAGMLAGPACSMGLVQAWELARMHDPAYRAARHADEAAQEGVSIGRSALLPSVTASWAGSRNRTEIGNGLLRLEPEYISRAGSVALRQPLFNMDAWARYRQAIAQGAGSAAQREAAAQTLIVRVAAAYIDVLYSDDQVALANASRDMLSEQNKVNARLFDKGEGTRTDMLETQARLDLAEARLLEAQDGQRAARAALADMTGADVGVLDTLAENFAVHQTDRDSFAQWRERALAANPELRAGSFLVEEARAATQRARAAVLPRVEFVASYASNSSETINNVGQESIVRSIGVQVNVPLYAGGALTAGARQAVANAERVKAEQDERRDKLLLALRKDYDALTSSVVRIEALQRAAASATLLMHATTQSIKGGVRINLDLLVAQEQYQSVRRDLAQARYNYVLAALRLRAAAGTLDGDALRALALLFH